MSVAYLKGLHLQKYKYSLICMCARVCVHTRGGKWSPFKCFSSGTQILFLTELEMVEWRKPDGHKAPDLPTAWDGKHKLPFLALLCGLWDSNQPRSSYLQGKCFTDWNIVPVPIYLLLSRERALLGMRVTAHMWSWRTMSGSWLSPSTKRIMRTDAGGWAWGQAPFFVLSHQSASYRLLIFLSSF